MSVEIIQPNAKQFTTELLLREPSTGVVSAVATSAVELKAGGSAVSGRVCLRVKNLSDMLGVRIGGAGVSQKTGGILLEPLSELEAYFFDLDAVSLYATSTGYEVKLEVTEA